jgi:hypothetical protein
MTLLLDAHFAFAFFVFLCAILIGWVQLGRRVLVTVIGIQVALGIALAAWDGARHIPLPPRLGIHILGGLLAMGAYIAGRRIVDRSPNATFSGLLMSFIGFLLVCFTIWYGWGLVTHG